MDALTLVGSNCTHVVPTVALTYEDDTVEPALGVRVEVQVALGGGEDEGHGDHVHLLARGHEPAYCQQEVVELAVTCYRKHCL